MKAASISEIKQELGNLPSHRLLELCIHLTKFKKENKELLSYLLFQSHDMDGYILQIKSEMDELFEGINTSSLFFVKKSLRKILRIINRYIKHMASKQAEVELLIHFCAGLKKSGIPFHKSTAIVNLYAQQLKKIKSALALMHEDLQYDYVKSLQDLELIK